MEEKEIKVTSITLTKHVRGEMSSLPKKITWMTVI